MVFLRQLFNQPVELTLRASDLPLKQIGTVLQVATDVAH
jgi:hypothetical protein